VSIYWSITAFELLPIITERFPFPKVTHFIHEIMLPFVILGVTLSTMHHSSLGSLFMLSPTRLYPLWYSLWIPPEFFISAMGAGLSVITLLMMGISKLYKRKRDMSVLTALVKGSAGFLALYLIIKVADFTVNEKWNFVFGPDITWETYLFWVEISLQAIIPIFVFVTPVLRNSKWGLLAVTLSAAAGIIMHRLNTGIVGYFRTAETIYIPNASVAAELRYPGRCWTAVFTYGGTLLCI
jgi:Ni/Fe-hydrogenase subunit HybB-like protein